MSMSKQVTFTLTGAIALSALIPGVAGYATAQFDTLDRTRAELLRLQSEIRSGEIDGQGGDGQEIGIAPAAASHYVLILMPRRDSGPVRRELHRLIRDLSSGHRKVPELVPERLPERLVS